MKDDNTVIPLGENKQRNPSCRDFGKK